MCLNSDIIHNYDSIVVAARGITKNKLDAIELINDTYIKIHNSGISSRHGKFMDFFFISMRNCFLDKKRRKVVEIGSDVSAISITEDNTSLLEIGAFIDSRLAKVDQLKQSLRPHEVELFELIIEKGMSKTSIAKEMRCSRKAIESLFNPVKEKIKALKYGSGK